MQTAHKELSQLLDELSGALQQADLWSSATPTWEQLSSQQPFAYDVMTLQEWLQWIFIPRMKALIDNGALLPKEVNITALAQETIAKLDNNTDEVMALIARIDAVMGSQ